MSVHVAPYLLEYQYWLSPRLSSNMFRVGRRSNDRIDTAFERPWTQCRMVVQSTRLLLSPFRCLYCIGLLAKKAVEAGLSVNPYIKTSLSPGSGVVTYYLKESGVIDYLEKLG